MEFKTLNLTKIIKILNSVANDEFQPTLIASLALNFNLLNSETNNNKVKCQGHGLEFDLKTGFSSCSKFKLKNFKILEQNNYYFLQS